MHAVRKFMIKYLNCQDLCKHTLSSARSWPSLMPDMPPPTLSPPLTVSPPPMAVSSTPAWSVSAPTTSAPRQAECQWSRRCWRLTFDLCLGPLLNSLHEDFHTEPISVLCHLNDNGDAKTNKHPFQFFKDGCFLHFFGFVKSSRSQNVSFVRPSGSTLSRVLNLHHSCSGLS